MFLNFSSVIKFEILLSSQNVFSFNLQNKNLATSLTRKFKFCFACIEQIISFNEQACNKINIAKKLNKLNCLKCIFPRHRSGERNLVNLNLKFKDLSVIQSNIFRAFLIFIYRNSS